jgi:mRNA interferase MazF
MITSAKHSAWFGDYEIQNLAQTGLKVRSIVRQKMFALDQRLIVKQMGLLTKKDISNVQAALKDSIGL